MKKRILLLTILALFLPLLNGCGEADTVSCVTEYTNAVISNDFPKAQSYLSADADAVIITEDALFDMAGKKILNETEVAEVTTLKEGKNKAYVSLTINTPNPTKLMNRAVECAINKYFIGDTTDQKGLNDCIAKEIKADLKMSGLTIEPETIKVALVKEEHQWKITETSKDAINDVVIGNVREVALSEIQ